MGLRIISYTEVSCDRKNHVGPQGTKILSKGTKYIDASYCGLIICEDCWNQMTKEDVLRVLMPEIKLDQIVGKDD